MKSKVIVVMALMNTAAAKVYTKENAEVDFENFKRKYNKNYSRTEEERRYQNFVTNMNNIERLNTPEHIHMYNFKYAPNKYIDLDKDDMEDQYAAQIPCKQESLRVIIE